MSAEGKREGNGEWGIGNRADPSATPIAYSPSPIPYPRPIGIGELQARFRLGPRTARALMRRMRHLVAGTRMWTTEAWLAEWCAAQAIPGSDWPAVNRDREPIDEDVVRRAVELVGMLADRGVVRVVDGPVR